MDVGRAVRGQDLPIGAARQDTPRQLLTRDGSAQDIHHAAMPEGRGPNIENIRQLALNVEDRIA
jgi:hypothetical protein